MTPTPPSVHVALGARAYDVRIGTGLLETAGRAITEAVGPGRRLVVADAALQATPHLARLQAGLDAPVLEVAAGEGAKSLEGYATLVERLLAERPDRGTVVVAMGGGVVGDLAGFAAATLLRGVRYVQIPTTLLAQVDSSVGGKTGINSRHGKNLIGAFHQPRLVIADLDTLATLPPRERRAGYAEVVKYACLGDDDFFAWLETHGAAALAGDTRALAHVVARSVRAKADIVVADEEERSDRRALLNLGHTFAHAYETLTGYGNQLLHGEAVALGLVQAFRLSVRLGLCPAADAARVERHLEAVGLATRPSAIADFPPEAVLDAMARDKKAAGGRLTFVLVHRLGAAFVSRDVDAATALAHLRDTA